MFVVQFALSPQVGEQLTARDVLHEEEKVARVLREPLQPDLATKEFLNYNRPRSPVFLTKQKVSGKKHLPRMGDQCRPK